MKTIHAAIAIAAALIAILWWGVQPPRYLPRAHHPQVESPSPSQQCPATSVLEGKLCVCPEGSEWKNNRCVKAWDGAARLLPVPPRAGSMARMERVVGDFSGTGNIAIVEAVDGNSLTIIEGDAATGTMTRRSASGRDAADAARRLGIVGYVQP